MWWWTVRAWLRHPVRSWRWHWKAAHLPVTGQYVKAHGRALRVIAVGVGQDTVTLEDGQQLSWMYCCEPVRVSRTRSGKGMLSWLP